MRTERRLHKSPGSLPTRPRGVKDRRPGKTASVPRAILHTGIIREIATKDKDARFRKTDRGMFTLAK